MVTFVKVVVKKWRVYNARLRVVQAMDLSSSCCIICIGAYALKFFNCFFFAFVGRWVTGADLKFYRRPISAILTRDSSALSARSIVDLRSISYR